MKIKPLLFFVAISLVGCLGNKGTATKIKAKQLLSSIQNGKAIPENICVFSGGTIFWNAGTRYKMTLRASVGVEEIISTDSIINTLIDKYSEKRICQSSNSYRKQYQFLGDEKKGVVLINLLPKFDPSKDREDFFQDWREREIIVMDGGNSFCGIEYDIQARKALLFQCNGLA